MEPNARAARGRGAAPARWWLLLGEEPSGPIGVEEARRLVLDGAVTAETYVWADGMPQWFLARDVPALTPPVSLRQRLAGWA